MENQGKLGISGPRLKESGLGFDSFWRLLLSPLSFGSECIHFQDFFPWGNFASLPPVDQVRTADVQFYNSSIQSALSKELFVVDLHLRMLNVQCTVVFLLYRINSLIEFEITLLT